MHGCVCKIVSFPAAFYFQCLFLLLIAQQSASLLPPSPHCPHTLLHIFETTTCRIYCWASFFENLLTLARFELNLSNLVGAFGLARKSDSPKHCQSSDYLFIIIAYYYNSLSRIRFVHNGMRNRCLFGPRREK